MRYRCEILNHGIDGYEVWLHGRNQGRSGVKYIIINLNHNRIPRRPVYAPEIRIVEIENGKYDNEMCELSCNVIITVKKGNILYIMHDVSHEILILDTVTHQHYEHLLLYYIICML